MSEDFISKIAKIKVDLFLAEALDFYKQAKNEKEAVLERNANFLTENGIEERSLRTA